MSRVIYNDDADNWDIVRAGGAAKQAIYGKPGQAALREIKAALEALPQKRLAWSVFQDEDGDVCPLGALAKSRGMDITNTLAISDAPIEDASNDLGITPTLAAEIMAENDELLAQSPEQRYSMMMAWIDGKLA